MKIKVVIYLVILLLYAEVSIGEDLLIKWQFQNKNVQGYIIPSLHYTNKKTNKSDLESLLKQVRAVYFETFKSEAAIDKKIFVCNNNEYCGQDLINQKLWQKINERFNLQPKLLKHLSEMKLWALSILIGQHKNQGKSKLGLEHQILVLNAEFNYPILGLQSRESLLNQFNGLPLDAQFTMLEDALSDDDLYFKELDKLSSAWSSDCIECVCNLANKSLNKRPVYAEAIVYQRNEQWVDYLLEQKHNEPILVVVGAAHFCGEKNVISLMKKAGFTIKQ